MTRDFNKSNISSLDNWNPGDPLAANHLQQPVDVLKALGGGKPPEQVVNGVNPFEVRMFRVIRLDTDVIICNFTDGKTDQPDEVKVAMPFLLRRTPFDDPTATQTPRAGITYLYSDFHKRLATNEDSDEEDQILVDSYEEGDIIWAMGGIFGNTAVFHDDPVNETPVIWLDMNLDGRFWALDGDAGDDDEEDA